MKLKGFWKLAQFLTFIALLRCAFYHAQCGHKGRENPDIVNSQSLTGCSGVPISEGFLSSVFTHTQILTMVQKGLVKIDNKFENVVPKFVIRY